MPLPSPSHIVGWHAHVYFDTDRRDAALRLREAIAAEFGERIALGRVHERPVGPHPLGSFQLSIGPADFAAAIGWLSIHHGTPDILVHPDTGDALRDHRDRAIWIGRSHTLDLAVFG